MLSCEEYCVLGYTTSQMGTNMKQILLPRIWNEKQYIYLEIRSLSIYGSTALCWTMVAF
jgi:hypothetical protein